ATDPTLAARLRGRCGRDSSQTEDVEYSVGSAWELAEIKEFASPGSKDVCCGTSPESTGTTTGKLRSMGSESGMGVVIGRAGLERILARRARACGAPLGNGDKN